MPSTNQLRSLLAAASLTLAVALPAASLTLAVALPAAAAQASASTPQVLAHSAAVAHSHRAGCRTRAQRRHRAHACLASTRRRHRAARRTSATSRTQHAHHSSAALAPATGVQAAGPVTAPPASRPAPPVRPTASTAPCANADLMPNPENIPVVEAAALCLVNQVRGEHGLPGLSPDARLQRSAEQHNNDMIARNYFSHYGPAGDSPLSRIQAVGYITDPSASYLVGENIAWGTLSLATPSAIVTAWVNSPEHMANIMTRAYSDSGMAIAPTAPASLAQAQPGAIYTQDFGGVDYSQPAGP